jgi:hypothetical protein
MLIWSSALRSAMKRPRPIGLYKTTSRRVVVGGVDGKGAGAFCGWQVTILQPRECSIFPLGSSDDAFPPLHDGNFPLLSIIETVHFESVRAQPMSPLAPWNSTQKLSRFR